VISVEWATDLRHAYDRIDLDVLWNKSGAQKLLHARCALINGELGKYAGWSPTDSSLEQAVAGRSPQILISPT
jgi:hypothetical protein